MSGNVASNVASDAQMVQWLRFRTDTDPAPRQEQQIAVRLAEKLQADLTAALARIAQLEAQLSGAQAATDEFTELMFGEGWEEE